MVNVHASHAPKRFRIAPSGNDSPINNRTAFACQNEIKTDFLKLKGVMDRFLLPNLFVRTNVPFSILVIKRSTKWNNFIPS